MPAESDSAVLHITAAAGGGADRYLRDLAAQGARRHFVLHAGPEVDVLEDIGAARFTPVRNLGDGASIAPWLRRAGVGIVHLHGVDDACRARLAAVRRAQALPYVVTLHDIQFVNPRAFELPGMPDPEPDWIAKAEATLAGAARVIAPSAFIRRVALDFYPDLDVTVIPPGIGAMPPAEDVAPPPDFAASPPKHVVAVVGAIGPHKGSGLLDALAAALEGSDLCVVVIGYTDTQMTRGWRVPGRLYVHGPYVDGALAGWLAGYRVEVALFPNRLPESFSYTLSEVWARGIPAVVPDEGALGERVERDGGGWCLPAGFSGTDAAALLIRLFSPEGAAERARVKSQILPGDTQRIPTLEAMARDIDAVYARFALPPTDPPEMHAPGDALAPLLAANLDGFVFRKELVNLAGQLAQANKQVEASREWGAKLERDAAAWAAKLEADIAVLKRDQERLGLEVGRLSAENARLADAEAAFSLLPGLVRKVLLKRVFRARS